MKLTRKALFATAAVLVLLGVLAYLLQPGPPAGECVPEGAPSSGWVDEEKNCPVSIESFAEIRDYEESPKPFRILGLVLVVLGIGVAILALVRKRGPDNHRAAA